MSQHKKQYVHFFHSVCYIFSGPLVLYNCENMQKGMNL